MFLAWALRAGCVLAAMAVYLAARLTDIESVVVLRLLDDPSGDQVSNAIAIWRLLNHVHVVLLAVPTSVLILRAARPYVGTRRHRPLAVVVAGAVMFITFGWLVQVLSVRYLAFFLLGGASIAAAARLWRRAAAHAPAAIGSALSSVFLAVPFLSEVLSPRYAFLGLYEPLWPGAPFVRSVDIRLARLTPGWTFFVLCHASSYGLAILAINAGWMPDLISGRRVERIAPGNYHGLEMDWKRQRLLATRIDLGRLEAYTIGASPQKLAQWDLPTPELENIRINPERDELYHFDRGSERLRVYSADDLSLKRESTVGIDGGGTAQIEFDNGSRTILVTRESDFVWLFDMDSLALIHQHADHGEGNADVLFSPTLKKYVLSYYTPLALFRTLTPSGGSYEEHAALPYQNDLQESRTRRELFVTLPVESSVLVFDLDDLDRRKRSLRTTFGVRGMAYDETHDLLITVSMVNGNLDVLDPETGRVLDRAFVGYYLREIVLNERRREAFISSRIGGLYRFRY